MVMGRCRDRETLHRRLFIWFLRERISGIFLKGKIDSFTDEMTPETCYSLAIKGPAESWKSFCQEVPPPMYNDLWAMAHPLHGR